MVGRHSYVVSRRPARGQLRYAWLQILYVLRLDERRGIADWIARSPGTTHRFRSVLGRGPANFPVAAAHADCGRALSGWRQRHSFPGLYDAARTNSQAEARQRLWLLFLSTRRL